MDCFGRENLDRSPLKGIDEGAAEASEALDQGRRDVDARRSGRRAHRRSERLHRRLWVATQPAVLSDVAAREVPARPHDDERPVLGSVARGLRGEVGGLERRDACVKSLCHGVRPFPSRRGDRVVRGTRERSDAFRHWHAFPPRRRTSELRFSTQRERPNFAPPVRRSLGRRSERGLRGSARRFRVHRVHCPLIPWRSAVNHARSRGRSCARLVASRTGAGVGVLFGHASLIGWCVSGAPHFVRDMFSQTKP